MSIMFTEKLYLTDSYIFEAYAKIIDIRNCGKYIEIILDKTPLFPGGGGQPADEGFIDDLAVCDISEKNDTVIHRVYNKNSSFSIGDSVIVKVSAKLRMERMRAHTGEHILSGLAHNLYGVNNVGFHMDENNVMTVDFDKYLDKLQLNSLEYCANQCVMRNLRIDTVSLSSEEASLVEFRSKKDFENDVRIVDIDGVDRCACCAPHLKSTGETGIVKILSCCSHRGGVRLTLICGEAAYFEFTKRYSQILDISAALCSKYDDADTSVALLVEANKNLKHELNSLKTSVLKTIAESIERRAVIVEFIDNATVDDLRIINNRLFNESCLISFLFSKSDEGRYNYCIMSEKLELGRIIKDLNLSLCGRGGGKGILAQGSISCRKSDILTYIEELKVENYENA